MKLLTVGDVVGEAGIDTLHALLRRVKRAHGVDFVIVNGENAAGRGITPKQADDIFAAGADVVTLGNHAFSKQQIAPYLDERQDILRPANLAPQSPGQGWGIYDGPQGLRLLVMNLIYLLFGEQWAAAQGKASEFLYGVILGVIGVNGVPEAIVAALLTMLVGGGLLRAGRGRRQ